MWKRKPFNTPSTPLVTRQQEIGFEKTEALRLLSTGQRFILQSTLGVTHLL